MWRWVVCADKVRVWVFVRVGGSVRCGRMVCANKVRIWVFVRVGGLVKCKARLVCTNKVRVRVFVRVGGSVRLGCLCQQGKNLSICMSGWVSKV